MLSYREAISESISKKIGAPTNQIVLVFTMICIIPFAFLNYFIHGKNKRLLYSFIVGFLFQYSIYKINIIHTLISAIFTYLFIKYCGRKYSAYYVFIFSLVYLSYLHIKRMFFDYLAWEIDDPTTIYMMSICKYSSLAFSYEDGGKKEEEIKNAHHKEYRVYEKPTLLEVLSFIYFYPTSLIGPSPEYKDFINFINETDCYSRLNENIFYILRTGFFYFVGSFVCMGFYSFMAIKFPVSRVAEEDFGKHNVFYVLAYIYICMPGIRARYYSGWLLSYSTVIFSGIAYTEKKDKETGKLVKTLEKGNYGSIVTCEWGVNPKNSLIDWNNTIHLWLKYTVYTRVINIKKKPFENNWGLSSFLTFISSAIWHGYYLTYYVTFILLFFYQSSTTVFDKIGVYKWIIKTKYLIPLASVLNALAYETIAIFFFTLAWDKALIGARNMRYYPFIYIFGLYIISKMIKIPKQPKNKPKINDEKKEKKAE
jgi:lysophospholipid acyltransferase